MKEPILVQDKIKDHLAPELQRHKSLLKEENESHLALKDQEIAELHQTLRHESRLKEEYESRLALRDQEFAELHQAFEYRMSTLASFIRKYGVFSSEQVPIQEANQLLTESTSDILSSTSNPSFVRIPARDLQSLGDEVAGLKLHTTELESANRKLESKLKRYRQAIKVFKKEFKQAKESEIRCANELLSKDTEVNILNEKIAQLLNMSSVPIPPPIASPIPFGPRKILPSPPLPDYRTGVY